MIVRYHQVDEAVRDDVRMLENKGHIAYIRYLLLKRTNPQQINTELARLGLSSASEEQYKNYFTEALYPLIQKHKLQKYYKRYRSKFDDTPLLFIGTFGKDDNDRIAFCALLNETDTDAFFGKECVKYYGKNDVPLGLDGEPIIKAPSGDWIDILLHEKRHVVDGMIADGHSPKSISNYLDLMYDVTLPIASISQYARSFMNLKRKDLERVIEELEQEKATLQGQIEYIRENEELFSIGERMSSIGTLKQKVESVTDQIKRLQGEYGSVSYSQGVLEYSGIREIFSDVMLRTARRYRMMEERTEDSIVDPLSKLVNIMAKAQDKIIGLDVAMKDSTKKTISEEMLEVVVPTLDRVEQEQREAHEQYKKAFEYKAEDEDDLEILGDDD